MNCLTWSYFTIVRNLSTDGKYSLGSFVVETNLQEFFPAVMIVKFEMLILNIWLCTRENHRHWDQTCGKLSLFVWVSPVTLSVSAQVVVTCLGQHWSSRVTSHCPADKRVDRSVVFKQCLRVYIFHYVSRNWPTASNISCFMITNVRIFHANKMCQKLALKNHCSF